MTVGGIITSVSVAHPSASVDQIAAASAGDPTERLASLLAHADVQEAFVIQTCNRAEAYVVSDSFENGRDALADVAAGVPDDAVTWMGHEASLRHLIRVAAGLESLVLGEDQILGQLGDALSTATAAGAVDTMLEDAVVKAIHVGERARTETAINEGVVSLGGAAVEVAADDVGVAGAAALVVGAGEMGRLAARSLAAAGVDRLVVANRTVETAASLAADLEVEAEAVSLDDLGPAASSADIVISATGSPEYVLDESVFTAAGETLVIDIAQPRDVAPDTAGVPGVRVYDIDDLEDVTAETRARRRDAAEAVERLIDEEFHRLLETFKRKRADEAISAMYESAHAVKGRELETALTKLEAQGTLSERQRETVAALADALVSQLLAPPTKSLREAAAEDDWTTIQTAMRLFDPEFGEGLDVSIPRSESDAVDGESREPVREQLSND